MTSYVDRSLHARDDVGVPIVRLLIVVLVVCEKNCGVGQFDGGQGQKRSVRVLVFLFFVFSRAGIVLQVDLHPPHTEFDFIREV